MQIIEDLISEEVMGGWPIYKMNLKEILLALGAEDDGTYLKFHVSDPKLKIYPQRLTDDGMGYSPTQEWIHIVDVNMNDDNPYINLWTELELPEGKLKKLKDELIESEKLINKKKNENCG